MSHQTSRTYPPPKAPGISRWGCSSTMHPEPGAKDREQSMGSTVDGVRASLEKEGVTVRVDDIVTYIGVSEDAPELGEFTEVTLKSGEIVAFNTPCDTFGQIVTLVREVLGH